MVDGMGSLDYPTRLEQLGLPTLLYRRNRGDMIEVWKHLTYMTLKRSLSINSNSKIAEVGNTTKNSYGRNQKTAREESKPTPFTSEPYKTGTISHEAQRTLNLSTNSRMNSTMRGWRSRSNATIKQHRAVLRGASRLELCIPDYYYYYYYYIASQGKTETFMGAAFSQNFK